MVEETENMPAKNQPPILIVLGLIIGLGVLTLVGMLAFALGKSQQPIPLPTPTSEASSPTPEISPSTSPMATITTSPVPTPTDDESVLIKQAIFKLTGLDATKAEVTINKNTGTHAQGNIKEFEAVGGAYFLAAKTESGWVGVYAGQATPKCSEIAPYNFPKDMVPECLDETGKVVGR